MKILLTGPTGFIGKKLINALLSKKKISIVAIEKIGADVDFLNRNNISFCYYKENFQELLNFITNEKPDGIVHLASLVLVTNNSEQSGDLINSNVLFPTHLIEAAVKCDVKWFVNTGTFWQHYNEKEYSPVNLYAATKQAFEDIARYYFEASRINFVTVKLFDTFGPGDTRQKLFDLWLQNLGSGEPLKMSPGEQLIDMTYVSNITDGFLALIDLVSQDVERFHCGRCYVIKSEKRLTLRELANVFERETHSKLNIAWGSNEYRKREIMIPWQFGAEIPGWKPKITLEEGIRMFYQQASGKFKF